MNINQQWQRNDALLPQALVSYIGSSLLTNTTTYCTRDQTFLASGCFISNEFLYSYLPCKVFFSMPAHSQQLTWSLIVLNCKLNQHCFSLYFNVFKKEGGGGGVFPVSGSAPVYNLKLSF